MPPSIRGYDMFEVVSAYQKAIRRSDVDAAIYWGAEAHRSGFAAWIWKRLRIIVSEDCGPAAPGLPADVHALYSTAKDLGLKDSGLMFVHAHDPRRPSAEVEDRRLGAVHGRERRQAARQGDPGRGRRHAHPRR